LLFASLIAASAVSENPKPSSPPSKPPFLCYTEAWDSSFKLLSTRYDRKANRVIWTLEAKKDLSVKRYQAFIADGDGVETATLQITLDPKRPDYKKGSKIQAVVPLGNIALDDICKLTVQERP
jgi:hypothetical protein